MRTRIIICICIFLSLLIAGFTHAQTTHVYKGKTYQVETGSKGGKYFVVDGVKHYLAAEITTNGNVATYKGKQYPIQTGPKGGRFIIVGNNKHYLPKGP